MPELIEVELYRTASEAAVGREITAVEVDDSFIRGPASPGALRSALVGRRIIASRRHGKLLLLDIASGGDAPVVLGLRFGMTGRLIVDGYATIEQLEYSSDRDDPAWDRFSLRLADGGALSLRDPRRLGSVELAPDTSAMGPDAATIDADSLIAALGPATSPVALKTRLLDQRRIAGIGNLIADEALWRAQLDPAMAAGLLTPAAVDDLARTLRTTIAVLTARGGAHTGDLQIERGRDGHCPRCAEPLQRRTIGGRTTYSCADCQTDGSAAAT